jgi:hypothetical protein
LIVYGLGFGWLALLWVLHGSALPQRFQQPWRPHHRQYALLLVWMGMSVVAWYFLAPPASQFPERLSLCLFVPGTLVLALVFADGSRMLLPARATGVASVLAVAFLFGSQLLRLPVTPEGGPFHGIAATFEHLNQLKLQPDARVYASPASHFVLGFYSSKPIQSLAPVRKSFLDTYPGEVVFVESMLFHEFASPDAATIEHHAARYGHMLSREESNRLELQLRTYTAADAIRDRVSETVPPRVELPPFAEAALSSARQRAESEGDLFLEEMRNLSIYRDYSIRTGRDIWEVFFYRLVDPDKRRGPNLNAADRLRGGTAYVVPEAFRVIFYSPSPTALHRDSAPSSPQTAAP